MAEPRKTLVEIRDDIEADLATAVEHAVDADTITGWGERTKIVRDLAGALIDIDQVCMARGVRAPAPNIDKILAIVWNATQENGCTTLRGDQITALVGKALAGDDAAETPR